jgi:hypothetical protein
MAKLVGVINTSHSPFCYLPAERWDAVRERREPYREDVVFESKGEQQAKADRVQQAFAVLRTKLAEMRPDVLVIFGDDQAEIFDYANHPALAVYVGDSFVGHVSSADRRAGIAPPGTAESREVPGHPGLGTAILTGLLDRGFDPAFMMSMPNVDPGMGHAFMRPLESLTNFDIPTVPVLLNAYFAPQVSAQRCYEVGKAVRQVIDSYPEDLRVVTLGSGGLWHTPGQQRSWLDEQFDRDGLEFLQRGDIKGWAAHFDAYVPTAGDPSQDSTTVRNGVTGLPASSGPQGGTRETVDWIAASAAADGVPTEVVDYITIYTSPIGVGFSFTTLD